MLTAKARKWPLLALVAFLILLAASLIGIRIAAGILKGKVAEALGPGSEIRDLGVGFTGVVVEGLRIKGPPGWPAPETLRAERVTVAPSLLGLLSGEVRVRSITVVQPYLSAWRTKDGALRVLPSLLEGPAGARPAAGPPVGNVAISRITLRGGVVEVFDASVGSPPVKVRLEQIQATVRDVVAPALTGRTRFDLTAVVKGIQGDGRASLSGWAEVTTQDSSVKVQLRSVDLVALQPYLSSAAETRVRKGTLDLDLQAEVRQRRLRAPGKVLIADLDFAPARGASDTFLGVPRAALVTVLKNREGKIEVDFVLEGDVSSPRFNLHEALAGRLAASLTESLEPSIRGILEGAGKTGEKGAAAAGEAAKQVGGALRQLFGGQKR